MAVKIFIERGVPNQPITVKVESDTVAEAVAASNDAVTQLSNENTILTSEGSN